MKIKEVKLIGGPMDGKILCINDRATDLIYKSYDNPTLSDDAVYVWDEKKENLIFKENG